MKLKNIYKDPLGGYYASQLSPREEKEVGEISGL
jgi:hypothetical protein